MQISKTKLTMFCQHYVMRGPFTYFCSFALCISAATGGVFAARAQPAPGTANFDPSNPPTQTLVMRGETLFTIAERTRSPLQALIRVNRLIPPFAISPGRILRLPPLKVHVVVANEDFASIARRYTVDARSLAVFNRLARPVQVQTGQRIILPALVIDRFTGLEPQDLVDLLANEMDAGRQVTGAVPGQILRTHEAMSPNSSLLASPTMIRGAIGPFLDDVGGNTSQVPVRQQILGPSEDGDGVAVRARAGPRRGDTQPTRRPPGQVAARSPRRLNVNVAAPSHSPIILLPSVTDMPSSVSSGLLMWPIAGRIVETFGAKRDFRTLDGIEIEAPAATPFKAAANGKVVYVGNQLPGYGWLVLIRHADGIMSAYAYAQSVSVRENQHVLRGQVIGLVGTTGRATTPRLHFQIRYNTRPVDPLLRLPRLQVAT